MQRDKKKLISNNWQKKKISFNYPVTQLMLTYSKSTIETLEKGVKYVQS